MIFRVAGSADTLRAITDSIDKNENHSKTGAEEMLRLAKVSHDSNIAIAVAIALTGNWWGSELKDHHVHELVEIVLDDSSHPQTDVDDARNGPSQARGLIKALDGKLNPDDLSRLIDQVAEDGWESRRLLDSEVVLPASCEEKLKENAAAPTILGR